MEQKLESSLTIHIPAICEGCGRFIEGFSKFRIEDKSPDWGGGKRIVQYDLSCALYKEEVEEMLGGTLW